MAINRRDFLRLGSAGLAMGTLAPMARCPFFSRSVQAAMLGATDKKMLLVFLRGGMDGLNALIPHGDPDYNDTVDSRPTLFVTEDDGMDLNGFASANPNLAKMVDDVPATDVAWLHRIGYPALSRSHFSGQQYWENAVPGDEALEIGWINRLFQFEPDLSDVAFSTASVSFNQQVAFRGPHPSAHITNLSNYKLGDDDIDTKIIGATPSGDDGAGLVGIFSRTADDTAYDALIRSHGLAMTSSLEAVAGLDPVNYDPEGGAEYPDFLDPGDFPGNFGAFNFFRQLKDSVQLLKETECRVAGIELGGWDTHANQSGGYNTLLEVVAHSIMTVYQDTDPSGLWDDLTVVVLTEFGRTSQENGSVGTDHGEASPMFIAGGGVNGGVYNCDSTTWDAGDMFSTPSGFPRYLAHKTDYRTVFAEIIDKHFGGGPTGSDILDDVIPDWDSLSGDEYEYLDFLA